MNCCICGSADRVRWCDICSHAFCWGCRWGGWGLFHRGEAALKQFLLDEPPKYCNHSWRPDAVQRQAD